MHVDQLNRFLEDSKEAETWLATLGIHDPVRGYNNLTNLAQSGMPADLFVTLCSLLEEHLPGCSDPDMALNNLERLFANCRSPLAMAAFFERDHQSLGTLVRIFSSSQVLSDQLISDPESFELLRLTDGQPVARQLLVEDIASEISRLPDERSIMTALRRFKRRETLRIAYGDLIREQNIETVTRQISYLADAMVEAALQAAYQLLAPKFGQPTIKTGSSSEVAPAQFVVLALGKLGGEELNYSSDIDLMFLYDEQGTTDGEKKISNQEFFDRLAQRLMKLLTESTDLGSPYRIDMRLRPEGKSGPLVVNLEGALNYYDLQGRTWERQAFVKARPIAGSMELGTHFLDRLKSWIYRRYLNRADITGIKALKRRIERRSTQDGADSPNVKTGHGGIRDIEFSIQFLQLLNGGDLEQIRTGNTLEAIASLERVGCLTAQEKSLLEENYNFLRKLEHRLQIMFDLQTHSMPQDRHELGKVALRMGYQNNGTSSALETFKADYREKTALNRKILDHLLHDAFPDDEVTAPSVDLVLDPSPTERTINDVLSGYGFQNTKAAYENLMELTTEKVRFLSTRRCRHFLAAISSQLLEAISETPDPDSTLVNLSSVSDSVGGKGVLWELMSVNPATLNLYVRLCAGSPYLSNILIRNPGMIDELMDSLMLDKLPSKKTLDAILSDLCKGAEDIMPILHSFKNLMHLRVGVLDILGKKDIQVRHKTLSDVAEVCLHQIAQREFKHMCDRFGQPQLEDGRPCELIILGLGKIGGREPNYHSDLDIIFLYEGHGNTHQTSKAKQNKTTTNQHFFDQLGQRIIKTVNQLGPLGRLYELDPRLRPTGKNGPIAVSLAEFQKYHCEGQGQLWERQALCKARVLYGKDTAKEKAEQSIAKVLTCKPWQPSFASEIYEMRGRMEESASTRNLKRGIGGTVDIEFIVQMLQLKHIQQNPGKHLTGTLKSLTALNEQGYLAEEDMKTLYSNYEFLRIIEARLRLMNTTARHDLPTEEKEVAKLAYLLGYTEGKQLLAECEQKTQQTRRLFEVIFGASNV
ncbi:MAG: bifunctional [glutamate--ammonia ligase]-adenylyl-L-tyrosine phosphorylase/[glutamate--ammonia-ligase] adenylyltransferase [Pirellulales bacterium]